MNNMVLGTLQDAVLLFGGCYSNLQATQALQQEAQRLGIKAENCICTGDIVAYCAQANETVQLLRDWGVHVLMGNCEESLASDADDCGCGFEEGSACDVLANNWYTFSVKNLHTSHKDWMRQLPRKITFTYQHKHFAIIHGSVEHINQFVFASTPASIKSKQIMDARVDGVIGGHCGLPFTEVIDGMLWHNPGVIGMPANDGTARVWYSLWQPQGNNIHIKHCSLDYEAAIAKTKMREAGLDNAYADSLLSGLWPSMDVLPGLEKQKQGNAISESSILF